MKLKDPKKFLLSLEREQWNEILINLKLYETPTDFIREAIRKEIERRAAEEISS